MLGPTTYKGEHSEHQRLDLREAYSQLTTSMGSNWKEAQDWRPELIKKAEQEQAGVDHTKSNDEHARTSRGEAPASSSADGNAKLRDALDIHKPLDHIADEKVGKNWNPKSKNRKPKDKMVSPS